MYATWGLNQYTRSKVSIEKAFWSDLDFWKNIIFLFIIYQIIIKSLCYVLLR